MLKTKNIQLIFFISLMLKLSFITLFEPSIQEIWFIDFIKNSLQHPSIDPWSN